MRSSDADGRRRVDQLREFIGMRMYRFDFAGFFKAHGFYLDTFTRELGYSRSGMREAVIRGTIKYSTAEALRKKFPDVDEYITKPRRGR